MTIHFESRTGRLQLDDESFDALVSWTRGGSPDDGLMAGLVDAGVLAGGAPHPVLAPLLEAVTEPVCRLRLLRDGSEYATGWATVGAAALLLPLPDGMRELAGMHPSFLPAGLARVIDLGPRRRHDGEPWQLPAAVLAGALTAGDDDRAATVAGLDQDAVVAANEHAAVALQALAAGRCRRWTVLVDWSAGDGRAAGRMLDLLDASPVGVWTLESAGEHVMVWPTTPTAVWRSLTRLLPDDHEVGV